MKSGKFAQKLIAWHDLHGRHFLPWNRTKDPYFIWLSEVILQQTRVDQGLPYYERFVTKFPTIRSLAEAPLDEVLKLWEGLGYYSRARNLHKGAQYLVEVHNGRLPATREELLKIPGIGPYTSSAIASFAFLLSHAVVDGNVVRVIARLDDIREEVNTTKVRKQIEMRAAELLGRAPSDRFNRAMMDLGSGICLPRNPDCISCPVQNFCQAYAMGDPGSLPISKPSKTKEKMLFRLLATTNRSGELEVYRRPTKGIWGGLYFLPELDTKQPIVRVASIRHQLTHKDVTIELFRDKTTNFNKLARSTERALAQRAFPVPIKKLLEILLRETKVNV